VGLLGLIRWLPRAWPIVAAIAVGLFVAAMSFLYPVLIEPIFHRFEPLRDQAQVRDLRALADRAGVPVREVLVADASRRTTKENAYVSGFGATRRLVVYDTLLEGASEAEVRLVVAHELGHRRLRHVELGTLLGAVASAGAVFLLAFLLRSEGALAAARASGPSDPRVIPFVMLAVAVLTLLAAPPSNWLSRHIERAADGFALELTRDRETYERTMRGLALRNLGDLTPGPIGYRFLYTHPAPAERLAYADVVLPASSPPRNAATSEPSDPRA
jgi:STE24 endopeptidase